MTDDLMTDAEQTDHAELTRARADGWWLIERLPDSSWPEVWYRRPIAAWALSPTTEAKPSALIAVLPDTGPWPLRPAVDGRDGADYHQRGDAFHPCRCTESHRSQLDPLFCRACAGIGQVVNGVLRRVA